LAVGQLARQRRPRVLLAPPAGPGRRGPRGEAERGAGTDAGDRRRGRGVRLRGGEPLLHPLLSGRRAAGGGLPRRSRGHRAPDDLLHERGARVLDRLEAGGAREVRPPGRPGGMETVAAGAHRAGPGPAGHFQTDAFVAQVESWYFSLSACAVSFSAAASPVRLYFETPAQ